MVSEADQTGEVPQWRSRTALILAKIAFQLFKVIFWPVVLLVLGSRAVIRHAQPQAQPTPIYKLDSAGRDGGRP